MSVPAWVVFLLFVLIGIAMIVASFFMKSLALMAFGIWAILVSGTAFIASRTGVSRGNGTINAVIEGMPSWVWWLGAGLFVVAGVIMVLEMNSVLAFPS